MLDDATGHRSFRRVCAATTQQSQSCDSKIVTTTHTTRQQQWRLLYRHAIVIVIPLHRHRHRRGPRRRRRCCGHRHPLVVVWRCVRKTSHCNNIAVGFRLLSPVVCLSENRCFCCCYRGAVVRWCGERPPRIVGGDSRKKKKKFVRQPLLRRFASTCFTSSFRFAFPSMINNKCSCSSL